MQSGIRNTKKWVLEFEQNEENQRFIEPIMGWTGSTDTTQQLRMRFETKEQAIEFADKNSIEYEVVEPKARKIKPKSYADNFKYKKPAA